MARTSDQIYAELEANAHPLFTETAPGRAVLKALAYVLASAEGAWDEVGGWFEQLFRQKAEGDWLDLHAEMNGVERRPGEDDDTLRARAIQKPTELTVAEVARLTSEWLAMQGDGYSATITEPYQEVLDEGFFLDSEHALLTPTIGESGRPRYLAWVHLPKPEVNQPVDGFFLDEAAFLDEAGVLGEDIHSMERPYLRGLLKELEERRTYGVGYGITIDDYWQDAYWPLLT